jgi:hypothetical protein
MTLSRANRFFIRFLLLGTVIGAVASSSGPALVQKMLPAFQTEIQVLDRSLRLDSLQLEQENGERIVRLYTGLEREVTLNGRTFYPNPQGRAVSSTLVGNFTLPTVLLLTTVFAFPCTTRVACLLRALLTVPALLVLWAVGIPFVLWAGIWGLLLDAARSTQPSLLRMWSDFVINGGELALAIAIGLLIASMRTSPAGYRERGEQSCQ